MTLDAKIARIMELAEQKKRIEAELISLLGEGTRRGRPPKAPNTPHPNEVGP